MDRKEHWEEVYRSKAPGEVSWYQPRAPLSLELIRTAAPDPASAIIDVGGGASTLVDGLLAAAYRDLTVLDLSAAALRKAQERLAAAASRIRWIEADVLAAELPAAGFDVWHDRAVFHFLASADDQQRYVAQVRQSTRPGGHVVIATFAEGGPPHCSGLEVVRYTPAGLQRAFGPGFRLLQSRSERHLTPAGKQQAFVYCLFRAETAAVG